MGRTCDKVYDLRRHRLGEWRPQDLTSFHLDVKNIKTLHYTQTDTQTYIETDRQTDRQTDDRQTD